MRVGIQTWGSEGDLRPFFALAWGLAKAGHEVVLQYAGVDGRDHASLLGHPAIRHRQVGALGLSADEVRALGSRVFTEGNPLRQMDTILRAMLDPQVPAMTEAAVELGESCDVVAYHPMAHPAAAAAEKFKRPLVAILTMPMIPTRVIPPPGAPNAGFLNALQWKLGLGMMDRKFLPSVSRTRAALGLKAIKRVQDQQNSSVLDLCVVSPALFPRPPDWPPKAHVSGFLNLPAGTQPAAAEGLEAFFAAGPPPVFVTFGSMTAVERDPAAVFQRVAEAIDRVGCRAILQTGATVIPAHPKIFAIGPASHDALFPRCAAVVHHGGAGTTQAALRAGRPSVIVAHIADQSMWGKVLRAHGVAPAHLTRSNFTAKALAAAIQQTLSDAAMPGAAAALGAKMQAEDGVANAVRFIEGVR